MIGPRDTDEDTARKEAEANEFPICEECGSIVDGPDIEREGKMISRIGRAHEPTRKQEGNEMAGKQRGELPWRVTEAETLALNGLTRGLTRDEVAAELGKSRKTIDAQVGSAKQRLGAKTMIELGFMWAQLKRAPDVTY